MHEETSEEDVSDSEWPGIVEAGPEMEAALAGWLLVSADNRRGLVYADPGPKAALRVRLGRRERRAEWCKRLA